MIERHVFTGTGPHPCNCEEHLHRVIEVGDKLLFVCQGCLRTVRSEPLPSRAVRGAPWKEDRRDLLAYLIIFMVIGLLATFAVIIAIIIVYGPHHAPTPHLER